MSMRIDLSASVVLTAAALTTTAFGGPGAKELPPFDEIAKGYEQVISTADGKPSLLQIWVDKKNQQMLAELPRGYEKQFHFIAVTQAAGGVFAGLQGPERYVYWKRYGDRMAIIEPEIGTRSTGEAESKSSVSRLFTDRVLIDVPIVALGPNGQPVIDMDDLLVKQASALVGRVAAGVNTRLAQIATAKAFPNNVELAFEAPAGDGKLVTVHYSISLVPEKGDYKPRMADERVGYFTTVYRDLGQYDQEKKWVRYIDRWHLQKRDPKLSVSPPKEPIVFYLEHTIPVRYRRWIRQGVEYWNGAFRQVGLDNAIEVRIQDTDTNAFMDLDPEDVRYNFIRWLNNDISTAIGPHRAHPLTGQILDADVVLTDGWIRAYWGWYYEQMPELASQSLTPETLLWLEDHPEWDPRLLLIDPTERKERLIERARQRDLGVATHTTDPLMGRDADLAAIDAWVGDHEHACLAAQGLAFDMSVASFIFQMMDKDDIAPLADKTMPDELDGIPEWFVGPLLAELTCHEVGHTLGLRHNFKASSIYTLEQINSEEWKGKKPLAGSVMDYLPPNFNLGCGEIQGDFAMIDIGPYDRWAIEYGYTFDDPKKVLERVADPELVYQTDDDTQGPDPLARRYDFSASPLEYGELQMRIINQHRDRLLEKFVKDGQSWSKARDGYGLTLRLQTRALSMMANWIGGAHVYRDRKGDPNGRAPIEVVDAQAQRAALRFVIENALADRSFGLTPEMLQYLTVDKWSDQSPGERGDPTWPVHDRIAGIQASVLTMILNPTTLSRVFDNEYRVPAEEEALTLAELMGAMTDEVYVELSTELDGETFTERSPMISSLRRNLQSSMTDRLIALASGDASMPRTIRTLATHHLRHLNEQVGVVLKKKNRGQIDPYTVAHLEDLNDRIEKALNSVYTKEM